MPALIECDAAMSEVVLSAARAALPADAAARFHLPQSVRKLPAKQLPLVPLLMALLDAAEAVARAVEDNARDDREPLPLELAEDLAGQATRIGAVAIDAGQPRSALNWNLPSMSGKELI